MCGLLFPFLFIGMFLWWLYYPDLQFGLPVQDKLHFCIVPIKRIATFKLIFSEEKTFRHTSHDGVFDQCSGFKVSKTLHSYQEKLMQLYIKLKNFVSSGWKKFGHLT